MQAVIMAGGKGTRLRSVTGDAIPKPMALLGGMPILERQVRSLAESGFEKIWLVVGHLHEVIERHFGDGSAFGVDIEYVVESEPLGTAGGLFFLKGRLSDTFALVFGDLLFDIDWNRFLSFHVAKGADLSLLAHPNSHPHDSDIVLIDHGDRVTGIVGKKEEREGWYHNLVNAGLYLIEPSVLELVQCPGKLDFERDLLVRLVESGGVFGYRSPEYVKDVGTPNRLTSAESDIARGMPGKRNLKRRQKAVFLDRDGTINVHKGFLSKIDDLELERGGAEAVRALNDSGWLCIIITNQPVVARGECSLEELDAINAKLESLLGAEGAYVDDLLFCPHHPDKGFPGERSELKIECTCRKPATGLVTRAADRYNIDLQASWFVGDSTVDVQTGINAGTSTALVLTGEGGMDRRYCVKPELVFPNLLSFACSLQMNNSN